MPELKTKISRLGVTRTLGGVHSAELLMPQACTCTCLAVHARCTTDAHVLHGRCAHCGQLSKEVWGLRS